jgi:hypothetical protein
MIGKKSQTKNSRAIEMSADAISGGSGSKRLLSTTSEKVKEVWDLLLDDVGTGSRNWLEGLSFEPRSMRWDLLDVWSASDVSGAVTSGWESLEAIGVSARDGSSYLVSGFRRTEIIDEGMMERIQYESKTTIVKGVLN